MCCAVFFHAAPLHRSTEHTFWEPFLDAPMTSTGQAEPRGRDAEKKLRFQYGRTCDAQLAKWHPRVPHIRDQEKQNVHSYEPMVATRQSSQMIRTRLAERRVPIPRRGRVICSSAARSCFVWPRDVMISPGALKFRRRAVHQSGPAAECRYAWPRVLSRFSCIVPNRQGSC